jgi:diacylglycerol kinase family enzyme
MSPGRRFAVVMNPSSAGGRPLRLLPRVRAALASAGAEIDVIQTQDIPHAAQAAQAAAERGETVVALGGDGLVGALAGALKGAAPLGVLPGGRGNDFARALGIPQEIDGACRTGQSAGSTWARRTAAHLPASPRRATTRTPTAPPTTRA